jgi:hypothetical protein
VPLSRQVGGVTPDSAIPAAGIQIELLPPDETPVVDPAGQPVIATAAEPALAPRACRRWRSWLSAMPWSPPGC